MGIFLFMVIIFIICLSLGLRFNEKYSSSNGSYTKQERAEFIRQADAHISELNRIQQLYNIYSNHPIVKEHEKNLEKIGEQYSVLNNFKMLESPQAEQLIQLCIRDIQICKEFCDISNQYNPGITITYPTFKRLAIIYEKRKEYEKAAEICAAAIKSGFNDDGTTGKMHGRLARMIRLSGKNILPDYYLK